MFIDTKLDSDVDTKLDINMDTKLDSNIDTKLDSNADTNPFKKWAQGAFMYLMPSLTNHSNVVENSNR